MATTLWAHYIFNSTFKNTSSLNSLAFGLQRIFMFLDQQSTITVCII